MLILMLAVLAVVMIGRSLLSLNSPHSVSSSCGSGGVGDWAPVIGDSQSSSNTDGFNSNITASTAADVLSCMQLFPSAVSSAGHSGFVDCIRRSNSRHPFDIGPHNIDDPPPLIIALIVHRRHLYFRHVLQSLKRVRGIDKALIIISHDGYFPRMHQLVADISFIGGSRLKQVYHPYSAHLPLQAMQYFSPLHVNDTLNWPSAVNVSAPSRNGVFVQRRSLVLNGDPLSSFHSFLHDRHLTQAAPKHHYWWLWNYIYRHGCDTPALKRDGVDFDVIFLEEDHYVTPDLIETYRHLSSVRKLECRDCLALNLGFQDPKLDDSSNNVLEKSTRVQYSVLSNIGMVISRSVFLKFILPNYLEFCEYNDYNWDLTLYHMQQIGLLSERALSPSLSRVYHIGQCGMHVGKKSTKCDPLPQLVEIELGVVGVLARRKDHKFDDFVSAKWLEKPFSARGRLEPVEGWSMGRMWRDDGSEGVEYFWSSDINVRHCLKLAQTAA